MKYEQTSIHLFLQFSHQLILIQFSFNYIVAYFCSSARSSANYYYYYYYLMNPPVHQVVCILNFLCVLCAIFVQQCVLFSDCTVFFFYFFVWKMALVEWSTVITQSVIMCHAFFLCKNKKKCINTKRKERICLALKFSSLFSMIV